MSKFVVVLQQHVHKVAQEYEELSLYWFSQYFILINILLHILITYTSLLSNNPDNWIVYILYYINNCTIPYLQHFFRFNHP